MCCRSAGYHGSQDPIAESVRHSGAGPFHSPHNLIHRGCRVSIRRMADGVKSWACIGGASNVPLNLWLLVPPALHPHLLHPIAAFLSLTFPSGFLVLSPVLISLCIAAPWPSASTSSILLPSPVEMPKDPQNPGSWVPRRGALPARRSSPAVNNGGTSPHSLVQPLPEHLPEGQYGVWGVGDAVVGPGHVMELTYG